MMNRSKLWALALCVGFLSLPALADTLKLTSVTGPVVDGVYIYPYNFSINGSSSLTSLMCINYNLHTTVGEQWTADEMSIPTGNTSVSLDGQTVTAAQLRTLAVIDYAMETGFDNPYPTLAQYQSDLQFAAWSILDYGDVKSQSAYSGSLAPVIVSQAAAYAAGLDTSDPAFFSSFTLYTADPNNTTGWPNAGDPPQNFMGYTPPSAAPEPSSFVLLGTGMLGMLEAARRKIRMRRAS